MRLSEFAQSHPQASYVAYTFGLRHRWTYFLRTLSNIEDLLKPLERAIFDVLIPSMADHKCTELERDILSLPVSLGDLGFTNPTQSANAEFQEFLPPLLNGLCHSYTNHLTKLNSRSTTKGKERKGGQITQAIGRVEEFSTRKNEKSCQLS